MNNKISIAIDGPAAAGKSTVAKIVAENLSYIYIDTGAMYRALTYKAILNQTDLENEDQLNQLLSDTMIELLPNMGKQIILLDGIDVTDEIRNSEVTNAVSKVSRHRLIRMEMVERQQRFATKGGVVMDGRDIGFHLSKKSSYSWIH